MFRLFPISRHPEDARHVGDVPAGTARKSRLAKFRGASSRTVAACQPHVGRISGRVFDNPASSNVESLRRGEAICGRSIAFQNGDLRDLSTVGRRFSEYPIEDILRDQARAAADWSIAICDPSIPSDLMKAAALVTIPDRSSELGSHYCPGCGRARKADQCVNCVMPHWTARAIQC